MSFTTASSSSGSRRITVLGYLQDYADVSEQSHAELKSSFWHLTKSRRNVSSGILGVDSTTAFTAEMLREELRARIRLVDGNNNDNKTEGDLVDEDDSVPPSVIKDDISKINSPPKWKLYDVLEKGKKNLTSEPSSMSSVRDADNNDDDDDPTLTTGLRQRKSKEGNNEGTTSSWTIVREEDLDSNSDDDDDEKMLLRKDPIEFFYGHNRELKVAQRNAQNALAGYIQAANQAAALLTLLRETKE
ncbi:MAG: hypothetical protein ACI90V_012126 [Bacillariaceae sp.]|jgi:hypothetical protein